MVCLTMTNSHNTNNNSPQHQVTRRNSCHIVDRSLQSLCSLSVEMEKSFNEQSKKHPFKTKVFTAYTATPFASRELHSDNTINIR